MELREYFTILRERWLVVLLATLAGTAAGVAVTVTTTRVYEAEATSIVSVTGTADQDSVSLYQGSQYTLQRVSSYARSVSSPDVLEPVIKSLGLDSSVTELAERVSAESPPDTVLIQVKATDPDPKTAAAISNAVAAQLGTFVETLETPTDSRDSAVKVSITQPAVTPSSPVSPRPALNIALGLLVGLALGLVAAVTLAQLDMSVKSADDLHALTGITTLGVVPAKSRWRRKSSLITREERSPRAEAYRTIRTRLGFVHGHEPPKSVVVTSSGYQEGSTTTAANLAMAIANVGASVCLVEADLRLPRLAKLFRVEDSIGLTDVLTGRMRLDDVLLLLNEHDVTLMSAGIPPADPGGLVNSPTMTTVHRDLCDRFDIVIFDSPPLLLAPDAAALSARAEGAILVVRSGKTKADDVRHACEVLEEGGGKLVGTVLTMVKGRRNRRWYGDSRPPAPVAPAFRHKALRARDHRATNRQPAAVQSAQEAAERTEAATELRSLSVPAIEQEVVEPASDIPAVEQRVVEVENAEPQAVESEPAESGPTKPRGH